MLHLRGLETPPNEEGSPCKNCPRPMFPLSQLGARAAPWRPAPSARPAGCNARCPGGRWTRRPRPGGASRVSWARHQDDVRAAQRLRYEVFAGEMGARLTTTLDGHDIDLFDDFCEHLLVRDEDSQPGDRHLPRADAGPGPARRQHLQRHRVRPDPAARPARAHGRTGPQLRAPRPPPGRRDPGAVGCAGRLHAAATSSTR